MDCRAQCRRLGGSVRACIALALVGVGLVLAACGSSAPTASTTARTAMVTTSPVRPTGFDSVSVIIRRKDGTVCTLCTYLAQTNAQWQRGLMNVTDLDGRDGMLFAFPSPNTDRFWMKDTVMPLTAVWFGPDGSFVDAEDMEPCLPGTVDCRLYGPGVPATNVIEFPLGADKRLRIERGAALLSVGPACPLSKS